MKYLERLEALVEGKRPILGLFFRFDDEEFYMLVQQIRASLPEDLRRAGAIAENTDRIMEAAQNEAAQQRAAARAQADEAVGAAQGEAGHIVEAARAEAARIVAEARQKAEQMISQSEVVHLATAQAKQIVAGAETEAEQRRTEAARYHAEMRQGADEYARETLDKLDRQIAELQNQVDGRLGALRGAILKGRQMLDGAPERVPQERVAVGAARNGRG